MEIKAYPLDDTPYLANDLRHWQWNRTSGVYSSDSNLQTITNNDMSVTIRKGVAFLNNGNGGISTWIDTDKVLTIDTADGVLHRIDNIVIGWDMIGNRTYLRVIKGNLASNPIANSPHRDNSAWEIVIARIRVNAGTTAITSAMINDMRLNETVCGLVRDGVESIPTSALQAQVQELISHLEKAIVDAGMPQIIDGGVTTDKIANGAVTADKIDNSVLLKVYPIGSIYISTINTNPSTLFGGTWVAFATGRTIVGLDTTQTEFNTIEKTGGAKTHTLTVNEMPEHKHGLRRGWGDNFAVHDPDKIKLYTDTSLEYHTLAGHRMNSDETGGGLAHNNLQPYITVHMWKRTA